MLAALYGQLTPHPRRESASAQEDAYSLFYQRSLAMGWITDVGQRVTGRGKHREVADVGSPGLWSMHEAGQDSPGTAPGLSLAAWFQVGVDTVPPADRPLPVHPFLCCIRDVMSRLGTLRLQALQVLLPMQYLGGSTRKPALVPSLPTADWFATCDHVSRTPIRITLDSGQDRGIPSAAPEMHSWMLRWDQDTFTCESYSVTGHDPLAESFPYGDGVWPGPPLNRATFRGTLAEWSLDALGWLGGFLAEASTRHAITTPVLLTVSRADEAASG